MNFKHYIKIFRRKQFNVVTLSTDYKVTRRNDTTINVPEDLNVRISNIYNGNYESGGFILGYKIGGADEYTIRAITMPMEGDRSTIFSLKIASKHANATNKFIKNMNMTVLGIWHTHPGVQTPNRPSQTDLTYFGDLLKKSSFLRNIHTITNEKETTVMFFTKKRGAKLCQ